MKKLLLFCTFFVACAALVNAQDAPPPAEQYTGKYNFSGGSPVPYVDVKAVEGNMVIESPMGSANLSRIEGDKFSIVEYNGLAEFKRNQEGKVIGVKLSVMGIEIEGTREEVKFRYKALPWSPVSPGRFMP